MLYIAVILLMRIVQSVFDKGSSLLLRGKVRLAQYITYRQLVSALLALLLLIILRQSPHISGTALLLSAVTGISIAAAIAAALTAMKSGTVVLTNLFSSAGLLIPVVSGIFLFDEAVTLWQALGIVLLFVSAYMLIGCSKKMYSGFSLKTLALLVTAMVSNGITMLAQKLFSYHVTDVGVTMYSFLSFAVSGAAMLLYLALLREPAREKLKILPPRLALYGFFLSAAVFVISQLSTLAAKTIPSVILFPVTGAGGLIIAAVVAALAFKEKLNARSIAGIITGVLSLVIINLFQA